MVWNQTHTIFFFNFKKDFKMQRLTFFWYHTTASFTLEAIYISFLTA